MLRWRRLTTEGTEMEREKPRISRMSTDEGLRPTPHRRDCGLAPLSFRLPLKGGVMDGHEWPSILIVIVILIEWLGERD